MRNDLWSLLTEHRERLLCALAALLLAWTAYATLGGWRQAESLGPPKGLLPAQPTLSHAPFLTKPFARYWAAEGRNPFLPSGHQVVARGTTELPFPPLPPVPVLAPPPADPAPSLYRNGLMRSQPHLLALVAEPKAPRLKSGRPCTIKPRPHDVVQAKGDPKPIEGTIRRESNGRVWFYYNKPRGFGHPRNPLVVADLVVFRRKTGSVQEAYRERSTQAGDNADAHFALAQECIDGDMTAEADAELRRAIKLNPKHRAATLKLADLAIVQGKPDDEVGVYEAALAAGAGSPDILLRLGQRCLEHNLLGLAATHFAEGFKAAANADVADVLEGRRPLPKARLPRLLLRKLAEVRIIQGRRPAGADPTRLLDILAKAAPRDTAIQNLHALGDLLADRSQQALAALEQLAQPTAKPRPPASALNNLGALLFQQGDFPRALERFKACRAAAPGHTKAALNAVLATAAIGNLDEAGKLLAAIAVRPSGSVACQLVVGYLGERRAKPDEAIASYQGALQADPACFYALCGLGRCHLAKGELKQATAHFAKARLLRPDDPRALRGIGSCLYLAGEFAEAVTMFHRLASLKGATARDIACLGVASLRLQDRRRDAVALFDKAMADPRQHEPYALVGKAYLAYVGVAGTQEQAEELFRKAQVQADVPEVSRYAAQALRRIFVARREEFTTLAFQGDDSAKLPEGWRALGRGLPTPVIRGDALRFEGRPTAATVRQVVRSEPTSAAAAEKGFRRTFARFEAQAHVPLTNLAPVGVSLGMGTVSFQAALRTTLKPKPSRRLAWRLMRNGQASPWADLPGSVAVERFKLGIGLSERGAQHLDVLLDGRTVGAPIEVPDLRRRGDTIDLGLFAAPAAQQECLYSVREVEIVWKKVADQAR